MTQNAVKKDKTFAVNSFLPLPESKLNLKRPREEPFHGWPEKLPATIDGQPNKKRGKW